MDKKKAAAREDHGQANACAWLSSIREMVAALRATEQGQTATIDGNTFDDPDEVRERIEESALSVMVRSPWYPPASEDAKDVRPAEYEILLTTGGPALRIVGDLDDYGQPSNARLEYQDWFVPWETLNMYDACGGDLDAAEAARQDLETFVSCFYFAE